MLAYQVLLKKKISFAYNLQKALASRKNLPFWDGHDNDNEATTVQTLSLKTVHAMSHVWIHYIVSINVIISNWNLLAAFKLYLSFNIKELNENIFYEITNHGQKKVVYLFFFHIFKSTTNHLTFQMHTYAHLQSLL